MRSSPLDIDSLFPFGPQFFLLIPFNSLVPCLLSVHVGCSNPLLLMLNA